MIFNCIIQLRSFSVANVFGSRPKNIKYLNKKLVINLFRKNTALSITDVSKSIKLSKTTVIKIFEYLIQKELIKYKGKGISSKAGGKKPELYVLNSLFGYTICAHILNNKIMLATTDTNASIEISKVLPIVNDESLDKVTGKIADFINKITELDNYKSRKLIGISIAALGVTDAKNGEIITASRFPSWEYKAPILKILKEKTSDKYNFYVDNQIRYIGLAEQVKGLAKEYNKVFIVKAGSDGVGGGLIIDGKLYRGDNNLAGELGHMKIDPYSSEKCYCGGTGCLETLVSYEKIISRAKELYKSGNKNPEIIKSLTNIDVFNDSNNNIPEAIQVIEELSGWYSIGISNSCMMIDPELIIITGGIADAGDFFITKLREKVSSVSLSHMDKKYRIEYTSFYKTGSLIGAAINSINNYFENCFFSDTDLTV